MTDNTLFRYKIDKVEDKTLYITFEDGMKTVIPLLLPFPKTLEELDDIIKRFAKPKEILDAEQADPQNVAFIQEYVGFWREAKRYSFVEQVEKAKAQRKET